MKENIVKIVAVVAVAVLVIALLVTNRIRHYQAEKEVSEYAQEAVPALSFEVPQKISTNKEFTQLVADLAAW